MKKNELSFEEAMNALEEVVAKLDSGNATLNESIELYEKGISLSKICLKELEEAKQKIEIIKNENYEENSIEEAEIME